MGQKTPGRTHSCYGKILEAGKKIPKEWLDEYNEIGDRQEKQNKAGKQQAVTKYRAFVR